MSNEPPIKDEDFEKEYKENINNKSLTCPYCKSSSWNGHACGQCGGFFGQ